MDIKAQDSKLENCATVFLHGSEMLDFTFPNQSKWDKSLMDYSAFETNLHSIFVTKVKNKNNYIIIDFMNITFDGTNDEMFQTVMDGYINLLTKYFDDDKIILIRTNMPYKRANESIVKPCWFEYNPEHFIRITKLEDYFLERVNSYVVDLTKSYYLDKNHQFAESNVCYEQLCFIDIRNNIDYIITNKPQQHIFNTPNYEFVLKRFLQFYENIHKKRMVFDFMNGSDIVDQIVLNMSKNTIEKNFDDILYLKKHQYTSYDEIKNHHDLKNNDYFKQIVFSIIQILEKDITNPQFDYSIVFKENLKILNLLAIQVDKKLKELKLSQEITVNRYNVELYHNILLLYKNKQYKKALSALLKIHHESKKPILLDNWGSCISREPLNFCEDKYVVNNFICRCCCLDEFDEPADVSGIDFLDTNLFGGRWFNRCFKESLEKTSKNIISESLSEWIIIDFFDIINDLAIYRNAVIDFSEDNRNTSFMKTRHNECVPFVYYDKPDEYIKEKMDQYIAFIKNRYHDNIILVNLFVSDHYLDGQRKIKPLNAKDVKKKNEFVSKWQDYFHTQTNCYCIDIAKYFLADDLSTFGASIVHYEVGFNQEVYRYIDYIIQKQPKEKLYDDYSNAIKIERLIQIKSNNDDLSLVKPLFQYSEYDNDLFNLSVEQLKEIQEINMVKHEHEELQK